MSSSYTAAQLEEMRKAKLRQQLSESVQALRDQLRTKHDNQVTVSASSGVVTSVFIEDEAVGDYDDVDEVSEAAFAQEQREQAAEREELDFSSLLAAETRKPTRLEQELEAWIAKADERPIVSEKDERDRARLITELKRIKGSDTDVEDKLRMIRMRVTSYLQGAVKLTEQDREEIGSAYFEYCALCQLLGIQPTETLPHRVKTETARLFAVLERRKREEYVMTTMHEIMAELGCTPKDEAVLDRVSGRVYSVEGHPLCDVFIGIDGNGIMFEPIGETKDCSLEKRRSIERSAGAVCSLYDRIEEKAAERGVLLRRVYHEPAQFETMCVQTDVQKKTRKRRQRAASEKQQTMRTEE